MNIPRVPVDRIVYRDYVSLDGDRTAMPVMPFIPLLLLKLQAWMDHGESWKHYLRAKQPMDVADIKKLLHLFITKRYGIEGAGTWVPQSFIMEGRRRVEAFVKAHPETRRQWDQVTF